MEKSIESQEFDRDGFLAESFVSSIETIRSENAEWFDLAAQLNTTMMSLATYAMDNTRKSSMSREAIGARILLRSCAAFQGAVLLTERGMVAEGRTLVRNLVESSFCVAALVTAPEKFIKLIKDDSEASRQNQRKFVLDNGLAKSDISRKKLKAMIEKNEKLRLMSPKKIAELGPLLSQYLVYQRLSDGAAHTTARALDFHMHRYTDGSGWIYKWGPGTKEENAATLNYACLAAISIGIGVSELLNAISQNATFSVYSERLNKMPPVKII